MQLSVGIVMHKRLGHRLEYYKQHSDGIILIRVDTKPKPSVIVNMTSSQYPDDEVECIYEQIEELIKHVKGDENLIIMSDWKARAGCGKEGIVVSEYGLGERNDRGYHLVELCMKHCLVVGNTLFKNHKGKCNLYWLLGRHS